MKSKAIQRILFTLLGIAAILTVVAFSVVKENKYNPTLGNGASIIEPVQTETIDEDEMLYSFTGLEIDETNNTFLFYSNHLEVFVYADDALIYSLEKDNSIFGRTPGAMWNIMSLPVGVEKIEVKTIQMYPNMGKQKLEFQVGNAILMQRNVVTNSVIDVCVCLSILIIGVALFIYWLLVFRKTNEQKDVLYLGLFAWVFGVWAFGETQLAVFMFPNRAFWSYMAFTCLMIMCLPFLLFANEFLEAEDKYLHKVIAGYIVAETGVAQFLHLSGILSVKETIYFTLASIFLTMLYLVYAITTAIKRKKNRRKILANIIGLMALAATIIMDMGGYFQNASTANQLGKIGFLIYAVILGAETARIAQERVQENHKAEIYREMAHKDLPTGCFNRNAFAEDTSETVELTGVQLIVFDLNNLKMCNDTMGHRAGDKYIVDAAQLIQSVFGSLGKVYRIGGDEFCVLAKNISEEVILERRTELNRAVNRHRKHSTYGAFGIACGYATFSPELDKDIEETRHRADLSMYRNKKEIKEAN